MASPDDGANTQRTAKEEKPDVQSLQIVVKAQDGSELQFKIRHNTPLQKVFNAYAQKRSLQLSDCKFVCDGNILNGTQTAEEAQLEDGDVIDMMASQIGG
ncbi:hypothetical protein WJX79_011125 [Trebouxia sp. C0005]|nr:MAG: hypothetical protein FRX49_08150 [Trebouxia sp. A1-2]